MATRSERVDEAFEVIAGSEILLEVLALNEIPLRRSYFQTVTDLEAGRLVKALAKLANASMLEETDGLLFKIVTAEDADEIKGRITPERRRQIHEDSLAWAAIEEAPDPRFMIGHLLGAERFDQAARMAMDLLAGESDVIRARAWSGRLKIALDGMLDAGSFEPQLVRAAGVAFIERAGKDLKSRELARLNSRMKELDVSEDDRLLFDALVEQASQARAGEATARKAAEEAARRAESAMQEAAVAGGEQDAN